MPRTRRTTAVAALAVAALVVGGCGVGRRSADGSRVAEVALAGHDQDVSTAAWTAWPQALHDARHSGASPYAGPVTGHLRWQRNLEGNVTPGPVVARDGTIYAASNAGVLHALDPHDGHDLWTVDERSGYGIDQSTSPAVLPNGLILWPGPGGNLIAVSSGGAVRWRLALGGQVTSPAVRADGTVVVGNDSGRLVGLEPTGSGPHEAWRVDLGEHSYGSPVIAPDGETTYQSVDSGVVAVRAARVRWHWRVPSKIIEVSPAVAPSGTVVIGTNDPFEYGLDPADGTVQWRYRRDAWTYSSPGVTDDGIAYFGDHQNRIVGVDATTGSVLFRHQGPTRILRPVSTGIWTSVLVDAHHTVFAGTRQGYVYAVDRSGRELWKYDAGTTIDSYPALTADGTLVIGSSGGRLLAFGDR